jgi:hypothetical protein
VYWDLEWRLQRLGFDFTYDKRLYDRLLHAGAAEVAGHLRADEEFQRRSARFIENHDEPRSAAAFGRRVRAAAVTMSTLPGLRFYHDGQWEGRRAHLPVQLGDRGDEPVDAHLADFYQHLLAIVNAPVFHDGAWRLCGIEACDDTSGNLAAWQWTARGDDRVIVVNLGPVPSQGRVRLAMPPDAAETLCFEDLLENVQYPWPRGTVASSGLYVRLDSGCVHVFRIR